jgi:hypothetical protein
MILRVDLVDSHGRWRDRCRVQEGVEGTHEALKAILRRCTASKEEPSLASV